MYKYIYMYSLLVCIYIHNTYFFPEIHIVYVFYGQTHRLKINMCTYMHVNQLMVSAHLDQHTLHQDLEGSPLRHSAELRQAAELQRHVQRMGLFKVLACPGPAPNIYSLDVHATRHIFPKFNVERLCGQYLRGSSSAA
jgi:hypothetical protein